jgi:hypothetical protein
MPQTAVANKKTQESSVDTIAFPPRAPYRFTVEQYERMGQFGILKTNDRVELLEGWIVAKMTQNPPHNAAIDNAQELLRAILPAEWRVREQKAVRLADSEPEPDLVIVRGPLKQYAQRHPVGADIALAVEVADTSLEVDRQYKGRMYARARIPIYWIINLVESQVEVYTQPRGGKSPAYRSLEVFGLKDSVPLIVSGRRLGMVPVRDLIP